MTSPRHGSPASAERSKTGAMAQAGTSATPAQREPRRLLSLNRMAARPNAKIQPGRQTGKRGVGRPATGLTREIINAAHGADAVGTYYRQQSLATNAAKLAGHVRNAHGGKKDPNCNACQELSR